MVVVIRISAIALFGAAGSMGTRATNAFQATNEYQILHVEAGEAGIERLKQRGDDPVQPDWRKVFDEDQLRASVERITR